MHHTALGSMAARSFPLANTRRLVLLSVNDVAQKMLIQVFMSMRMSILEWNGASLGYGKLAFLEASKGVEPELPDFVPALVVVGSGGGPVLIPGDQLAPFLLAHRGVMFVGFEVAAFFWKVEKYLRSSNNWTAHRAWWEFPRHGRLHDVQVLDQLIRLAWRGGMPAPRRLSELKNNGLELYREVLTAYQADGEVANTDFSRQDESRADPCVRSLEHKSCGFMNVRFAWPRWPGAEGFQTNSLTGTAPCRSRPRSRERSRWNTRVARAALDQEDVANLRQISEKTYRETSARSGTKRISRDAFPGMVQDQKSRKTSPGCRSATKQPYAIGLKARLMPCATEPISPSRRPGPNRTRSRPGRCTGAVWWIAARVSGPGRTLDCGLGSQGVERVPQH